MWKFWLILSGISFILEIFTTGFLIFWLGVAAIFAAIVSFFISNVVIQTIIFVLGSAILILFTRPLISKFLKLDKPDDMIPTNIYRLIGAEGIVIDDITSSSYAGKVKISGEMWSAISDIDLPKGTKVKVLSVDGVKIKVEPIKDFSRT